MQLWSMFRVYFWRFFTYVTVLHVSLFVDNLTAKAFIMIILSKMLLCAHRPSVKASSGHVLRKQLWHSKNLLMLRWESRKLGRYTPTTTHSQFLETLPLTSSCLLYSVNFSSRVQLPSPRQFQPGLCYCNDVPWETSTGIVVVHMLSKRTVLFTL